MVCFSLPRNCVRLDINTVILDHTQPTGLQKKDTEQMEFLLTLPKVSHEPDTMKYKSSVSSRVGLSRFSKPSSAPTGTTATFIFCTSSLQDLRNCLYSLLPMSHSQSSFWRLWDGSSTAVRGLMGLVIGFQRRATGLTSTT
ncbi:hypothetical protein PILCRDRAFT_480 [Piloderma croceum F 1598]|uniref:Uncharacterized protein n=1 Tax=Piloderma croceum (strain F 1598) TaxID=765440 RepID=A0A0C3GPH5_PILCF|nr:hypothetical protein PILCRDRAFT_480 [Piloderma croceum F 1598]